MKRLLLTFVELAGFGCLAAAAWLLSPALGLAAVGGALIVAANWIS